MRVKIYFRPEQRNDIIQELLVLHLQFHILYEFLVRRSPIRHKLNVLLPKWHLLQPQHIEVLKAVDLHLRANLMNRRNLGIHPEQYAMPLLLRAAIRQPFQHLSKAKHDCNSEA